MRKHIASRTILLFLWVLLLCISCYLKVGQQTLRSKTPPSGISGEQVAPEEHKFPMALSEPEAPHHTTTSTNPALLLLLPVYGIEAHLLSRLSPKPSRAKPGRSCLTKQFCILPNAP